MCTSTLTHSRGFTLVELMVTLAVAAILATTALPSFSTLIQSNRLTTQTNDLVSALNLARSEAIKRGSRVTVCKSANGTACTTSGGWQQGWIVFADTANAGNFDTGETIVRVHEAFRGDNTVNGNTNVNNYVSYVSSGATQLANGASQAGTLTMCDPHSHKARTITISFTGRALVAEASC